MADDTRRSRGLAEKPAIDAIAAPCVAVVDDERNLREMLALQLRHRGYRVALASDGAQALDVVRAAAPAVIVLDVKMPKIDGLALVPMLRRITQAPIIMLSARGDVATRVAGLLGGADDYVAKPFEVEELLARIEAALRRPMLATPDVIAVRDLEVEPAGFVARRGGRIVDLSALEFRVLVALLHHRNQVLSRDQLLDLAWDADADVSPSAAERCVSYLRAKLDARGGEPLVETVRGVGYVIRD